MNKTIWILFLILAINIFIIIFDIKLLYFFVLFLFVIFLIYIYKEEIKEKNYIKNEISPTNDLPDRVSLLKRLEESKKYRFKTLILINIDSFEDINDFFGYDFGDRVLEEVFVWLKQNLPDKNSELYKLEADNYAIFTRKYKTKEELNDYLNKLSIKIVNMEFIIHDNELDIGFTMGAAMNSDHLLKLTHNAYKKSKIKKTQFEIYSEEKNCEDLHEKNIKINKIIKKSIQNHKVIPFFQPIYDIKMNKISKYESLMRIEANENDIMQPGDFLQISKKSKLYPRLTKEIFSRVVECLSKQKAEYSINLSVDDILNKNTSEFILEKLENSDVGPWLVFEILESEGIKNYKEVTKFLRELKALGAKLAIDDFGSGYSNFEYILKLDIDFLKVDGSLIKNIDKNEDMQIITSTIVDFAKKLKIKTIAEFVHSKNIYKMIKTLGFDYAQGYYIGKPDKNIATSQDLDYLIIDDEPNLFNFWECGR